MTPHTLLVCAAQPMRPIAAGQRRMAERFKAPVLKFACCRPFPSLFVFRSPLFPRRSAARICNCPAPSFVMLPSWVAKWQQAVLCMFRVLRQGRGLPWKSRSSTAPRAASALTRILLVDRCDCALKGHRLIGPSTARRQASRSSLSAASCSTSSQADREAGCASRHS